MNALDVVATMNAILAEENAALSAMDLPAAAALLSRKQQAADALAAMQAALPVSADGDALPQALIDALRMLRVLAQTNKVLLEKALRVQQRLMKMIGDAARSATPPAAYGARGAYAQTSRTVAVALLARA